LREEDDPAAHAGLKELVGKLTGLWAPEHLVVTLGEHGMLYAAGDGVVHHVPALAHEVYDVSGAGDTAIAVFSLALAGGLGGEQATELANAAASKVVEKLGTATVTRAELAELLAVL
ncbi:MAG: PfkB family carbohydrate kinase, partial [Verrucomicrobiales bacterium]|nr:PfkB family carbohydrate kinase [Verrucomicrobiales bacterium]